MQFPEARPTSPSGLMGLTYWDILWGPGGMPICHLKILILLAIRKSFVCAYAQRGQLSLRM